LGSEVRTRVTIDPQHLAHHGNQIHATIGRTGQKNSTVLTLSTQYYRTRNNGFVADALIKHYGELAKLPKDKRHLHARQHSIATHLLDAGDELRFVQDWLGHSNIQNTVIYSHLVSKSRREKAR
jgi:site-specific recombinase XerD